MKLLLIINSIPTPYRTFMFSKLYERGLRYEFETTVSYQACREKRRDWKPDQFNMPFPHVVSKTLCRRRPREWFSYWSINWDILASVAAGNVLPQPPAFWKRDLFDRVGPLDESKRFAMDYEFMTRVARVARMKHIPRFTSMFRHQPDQKSSTIGDVGVAETRAVAE